MNEPEAKARILQARAQALAREPPAAGPAAPELGVIEFALAGERFAIEGERVREVVALGALTPVPCAPPWVAGIVNVRGRLLAALDLKRALGLPNVGFSDRPEVLVVAAPESDVAIVADQVAGLRALPRGTLQAAPPTLGAARWMRGVTADGLAVLDIASLMAAQDAAVRDRLSDGPRGGSGDEGETGRSTHEQGGGAE